MSTQTNAAIDRESLPPLNRDIGYWGMVVTQFLGAFNDNVFKQLMLLLAIPLATQAAASGPAEDQQGLATVIFSLPFVLFSGFAGYLSDRYSKRFVVLCCKAAEIGITLLGMLAFLRSDERGQVGLLAVLFLMGVHSAFFGPGKLGILPEILRKSDLPRANGIMLMTTFLAIILGVACAGALGDLFGTRPDGTRDVSQIWKGSCVCAVIAVIGFCTAWWIRPSPPTQPGLKFRWSMLAVDGEVLGVLKRDGALVWALIASSLFWMVSGITMQVVNSVGLTQLGLSQTSTSILAAVIGLGIGVGGALAGRLSGGKIRFALVRYGAWAILGLLLVLCLFLSTTNSLSAETRQKLGFGGSLPLLVCLGTAAGIYAIPLQVFLQSRPPEQYRGRMIGAMNQANFLAILCSGLVYKLFDRVVEAQHWPRSALFALTSIVIVPVALGFWLKDPE